MGIFSIEDLEKIKKVAEKSKVHIEQKPKKPVKKSINSDLQAVSATVKEYFKDSKAILLNTEEGLHEYITNCINDGYCGIDTETTGLDTLRDHIVGSSLYYPHGVECYIPNKHLVPIFDVLQKNQLDYRICQKEFQRLVDKKVRMIFFNADFDIPMLYNCYHVDFVDVCYYDGLAAWKAMREDEPSKALKTMYVKYVLGGKGNPKKFSDFFNVMLYQYSDPEIAKLYAAYDARMHYELFAWQSKYNIKSSALCKQHHMERVSDVVWGIEIPMIKPCVMMHRTGVYIDKDIMKVIQKRYRDEYESELKKLQDMVQKVIDEKDTPNNPDRPFRTGSDYNPKSSPHNSYLVYDLLKVPVPTKGKYKGKKAVNKDTIPDMKLPETNQIKKLNSIATIISMFTDKIPEVLSDDPLHDGRIHARFNSVGAATGRMSSVSPNLQQIPSHRSDIRHMFRATPGFIDHLNCDYDESLKDITVPLNLTDKVVTDKGEIYVKDVNVGDNVQLIHNGKEEYFILDSIEPINIREVKLTFSYDQN